VYFTCLFFAPHAKLDLHSSTPQAAHALTWIKRRLVEADLEIEGGASANANTKGSLSLLRSYFRPDLDMGRLRVKLIAGGLSNIAMYIYDCTRLSMFSSPSQEHPSAVFLKVAMPHPKWADASRRQALSCPVTRLDREFDALSHLHGSVHQATVRPLFCDIDECTDDGSKYLVAEYLNSFSYGKPRNLAWRLSACPPFSF
jgi:hypothetical protein